MSELVDRIAANVGLDRAVAEKSIGIILDFLSKEGPADKVSALTARLPESEVLLAAAREGDNGGLFSGMGGIMGVGSRLMGAGLDMGQIQAVTRELMAYSREQGVGDTLREIAEAIPGLGQFI
jgi:hypothetical protein